jgi:hypothetical protein
MVHLYIIDSSPSLETIGITKMILKCIPISLKIFITAEIIWKNKFNSINDLLFCPICLQFGDED